ncbi:hypothetical protein FOA52_002654 [Chlamydomonas sp. UWO 241]|nr:hypothetical protein FOA52_002654 [Chlamydomonas sp. UWO 241]
MVDMGPPQSMRMGGTGAAGAQSTTPAPATATATAWASCMELERRLKAESRKRSFWDPEVRRLRLALQSAYEGLIFADYAYAVSKDVEQLIWKSVHYRPIEEFRNRLKIAGQAVAQPGPAGAEAQPQQQKLLSAYLKFLDEAISSYKRLVWKLQYVYGQCGAIGVEIDASVQNDIVQKTLQAPAGTAPSPSHLVHKFLIYLGDLNRYQATAMKGSRTEWTRAIQWYRSAAAVLPSR